MNIKKLLLIGGIFVSCLLILVIGSVMLRTLLGFPAKSVTRSQSTLPTSGSAYGFSSTPSFGLNSMGRTNSASDQSEIAQANPIQDRIMLPIEPPSEQGTSQVPPSDRKIVKNGTLSIVVKDVAEAAQKISNNAVAAGGYVSTTNFSSDNKGQSTTGYVRLRIPVDKVDDFIRSAKGAAVKVKNENITSQDVTAQYIDLEARIKNLEVSELQYQEFMQKAINVNEVLTIQKELTKIRGEIEQLKGQLKYLSGNAEMSDITIYIALDEGELPVAESDKWRPDYVFKMALAELATVGKALSYIAIYFAVFAVVWVPVVAGLWLFYKFLRRKIR